MYNKYLINWRQFFVSCFASVYFKRRFANHKKSFNIERYEAETELSKEVWCLKRRNLTPHVSWRIVRECPPFNRASMKCNLCLSEKAEIALHDGELLNSRTELISKCRHVNKYTLAKHDTKDWRQLRPTHCKLVDAFIL